MGQCMDGQVNKLMATGNLETEELKELLRFRNQETTQYLFEMARMMRQKTYRDTVTLWGRIPISSYCKYNCKICGLRRENQFAKRYRLNLQQILKYCHDFWQQGVRHFLLESGYDVFFTERQMAEVILAIKKYHPDAEVILAVGEKTEEAFRHWFHVGASGYLLGQGSANELQFKKIYPSNMTPLLRRQSLWGLKQTGYQVGTGFLVGLPYQTVENVVEDIQFLKEFCPNYIDIGTFIPTAHTPFERERSGNGEMAIYIMAILRLMLPNASIIAGPSLDCVLNSGRMRTFEAGANTMIVDIDDIELLEKYGVYTRKIGRFSLQPDSIYEIKKQLQEMGLMVE